MEANVTIYTTGYCGFCTRAKSLLGQKGVRYKEVDVETREDLRDWLRTASGQRTVPQVFINGKSVGGYSDIAALEKEGKLDGLLSQAPPADAPATPQ